MVVMTSYVCMCEFVYCLPLYFFFIKFFHFQFSKTLHNWNSFLNLMKMMTSCERSLDNRNQKRKTKKKIHFFYINKGVVFVLVTKIFIFWFVFLYFPFLFFISRFWGIFQTLFSFYTSIPSKKIFFLCCLSKPKTSQSGRCYSLFYANLVVDVVAVVAIVFIISFHIYFSFLFVFVFLCWYKLNFLKNHSIPCNIFIFRYDF